MGSLVRIWKTMPMERTQDGKILVYGANERHELYASNPDAFPNVEEFDASDYFELGVDNVQTRFMTQVRPKVYVLNLGRRWNT